MIKYLLIVLFSILSISASPTHSFATQKKLAQNELSRQKESNKFFSRRWFEMLQIDKAWKLGTGKNVLIASCSPGYFLDEKVIRKNVLKDLRYDLSDRDNPKKVDDGKFVHLGTASASLMVGSSWGENFKGIAFEAKLVPFQNYNYLSDVDDIDKEEATASCVLRAMKTKGVRIIVLSNQTEDGSSETYLFTRQVITSAQKAGIIVVSAAGDFSKELKVEEANDSGSIIVGAVKLNGTAANFSNYGKRITVSAFGEGVSTVGGPNGQVRYFGGTSSAAAQVTAIIAIMLEINPNLTPKQVRQILISTRITTTYNSPVGGMIDTIQALRKAELLKSSPSTP